MNVRSRHHLIPALITIVATGLVASACGSTEKVTKTVTVTKTKTVTVAAPAPAQVVNVDAGEMYFKPTAVSVKSGKVRFVLKNSCTVVHELIVLKTDAAVDSLKVGADGRVSEKASVGEVSETDPGATKSETITLTPGKYLLVCNIPGHYAGGMRATMTVT
jgi:uncharacterized cupredoxin-like copper-binding protein